MNCLTLSCSQRCFIASCQKCWRWKSIGIDFMCDLHAVMKPKSKAPHALPTLQPSSLLSLTFVFNYVLSFYDVSLFVGFRSHCRSCHYQTTGRRFPTCHQSSAHVVSQHTSQRSCVQKSLFSNAGLAAYIVSRSTHAKMLLYLEH